MRSIKFGLALLAALAFSVAMSASASAGLFLSSIENANLLSEKVATQNFKTNAGKVECKEAKIVSGAALPAEKAQSAEIEYKSCLAFGFVPTTLKNGNYTFHADTLTVDINSEITIVGGGCEVKVPAQKGLSKVGFNNVGNNIEIVPNVSGIEYTATSCPSGNGKAVNGTYTGNSEAMIAGGSISYMPSGGQEQAVESELAEIKNPYELEAIIISIKAVGNGGPILGGTCKKWKIYPALAGCTVEQDPPVHFNVLWMAL